VANRTNQTVKVLTIWGTVSISPVVLTGFYGMNVKLPGQEHPHARLWITGAMIVSTLESLALFRPKNWF
jgi:magnesium transporter